MDAEALGARVADARGRASLTQADLAVASGLDRSAVAKIESGARRVSALELARIADAVGQRVEWFLDDAPAAIVSHRNLQEPGAPDASMDRTIEVLVRHVEFVQENSRRSALAETPLLDRPNSAEEAEERAMETRRLLGVGPDAPVLDIARLVTQVGVLVFSLDMGRDVADAAAVLLRHGAVVLVNGERHVGRRRLCAAHELAHCLFADDYTVDWSVVEPERPDAWEGRLDRFARSLLLPPSGLTRRWRALREHDDVRTAAVRVASQYRVDMATLARRLLDLGVVGAAEAAQVRRARTTRADIVEHDLLVHDELAAPQLPLAYQQAVLRLYRDERVSPARATDLLLSLWDEDDLPDRPPLPAEAIWQFLS